ncbi:hypothetical protein GCM10027563_37200 [Parasphingorhabdus pacifica]
MNVSEEAIVLIRPSSAFAAGSELDRGVSVRPHDRIDRSDEERELPGERWGVDGPARCSRERFTGAHTESAGIPVGQMSR